MRYFALLINTQPKHGAYLEDRSSCGNDKKFRTSLNVPVLIRCKTAPIANRCRRSRRRTLATWL